MVPPGIGAGVEFPRDFLVQIKRLYRLMFHVLAHIYHAHFDVIGAWAGGICACVRPRPRHSQHYGGPGAMDACGHLNTLFAHFTLFARVRRAHGKDGECARPCGTLTMCARQTFDLLTDKELAPMSDLIDALLVPDEEEGGASAARPAPSAHQTSDPTAVAPASHADGPESTVPASRAHPAAAAVAAAASMPLP